MLIVSSRLRSIGLYCAIVSLVCICSFNNTKAVEPLATTTIGSWPKPSYIKLTDWFAKTEDAMSKPTEAYNTFVNHHYNEEQIRQFNKAAREVIQDQMRLGIDVPTDGEMRRENYIYYLCRHIDGINFQQLTQKTMRNGSWIAEVPTITGPIQHVHPFMVNDYLIDQATTDRPIKVTLPGPLTIIDSTANSYYATEEELSYALAKAINKKVRALIEAGCTWIQIDEPVFARYPHKALAYGIDHLDVCLEGVPDTVTTIVHICCGYPAYVDQKDVPKANPAAYTQLAPALDQSVVKVISLEDAHRRNDPKLFGLFKNKTIALGVINICSTRVESVDEIRNHIKEVLRYIEPERLMIAPDCGLGLLSPCIISDKITNMCKARDLVVKNISTAV